MSTTPLADRVAQLECELAEAKKQLAELPKPLSSFITGKFYKANRGYVFYVIDAYTGSARGIECSVGELYDRETVKKQPVVAICVDGKSCGYPIGMILTGALPLPSQCVEVNGTLTFVEKVA